ncbi:hypothetical protein [Oerskovia paurometabola]|uniref:Uncharacterized protein n=1 Tax=Oerskovia paurometabola TaxID=162170 RepID=A0ABW1XAV2_9CELL|nr:hypothetical protein [Oerskovia paurometabola]MBM7497775.1 hypothetical protein [Oerskovia paurometabola]
MAHGTVYLREDWAKAAVQGAGGVSGLASILGVNKGTASRHINRKAEASGRFIAAVLNRCSTTFNDAFEVVEDEPAPTPAEGSSGSRTGAAA